MFVKKNQHFSRQSRQIATSLLHIDIFYKKWYDMSAGRTVLKAEIMYRIKLQKTDRAAVKIKHSEWECRKNVRGFLWEKQLQKNGSNNYKMSLKNFNELINKYRSSSYASISHFWIGLIYQNTRKNIYRLMRIIKM